MNEIFKDVLKDYKDKKIVLFLKNGFRHEGVLLGFDENNLKLDDRVVGILVIRLDEIGSLRGKLR